MNDNYVIFMQKMNQFKSQLEQNNNDNYKKVLKAVKDFMDAVDSMYDLNPKEAEGFFEIVSSCLVFSAIEKN